MSRLRALSLAAGLVGWSLVSPRLPAPWRIPLQAGLGSVLVLVTRATMGLWPPRLWAGLRLELGRRGGGGDRDRGNDAGADGAVVDVGS